MKEDNKPFLLKPAVKDYIWGGNKINDNFAKDIAMIPIAETWECSTHPDGISIVASGEFMEQSLSFVLQNHPEFLGTHVLNITCGRTELPILIKLIDAKKNLSIQVHPDDNYAAEYENGAMGKTELWYILQAKKDAEIIYGFNQDVSEYRIRTAIQKGTIENYLNHIPVHENDLFFIEAGTVHAIGAGIVLAEIQQNSNLTYRLYDYERTDKTGNPRKLHIDKALDVANLKSSLSPRQPMRVLKYRNGSASEFLGRCKYFQVERMLINTEIHRKMTNFKTDKNSFHVLMCIEGCGTIFGESFMLNFFKGDCIFVPARSMELTLHGKAQFLNVCC